MTRSPEDVVKYLDDRMHAILSAPSLWGGAEKLEPLILALLECRRYVSGSEDDLGLMRMYRQHLAMYLGSSSACLWDRLPEGLPEAGREAKAVEVLRAFVKANQ